MTSARSMLVACSTPILIVFSVFAFSNSAIASTPLPVNHSSATDRLVADVCDRQTVLLGEDGNHGSGATLDVKVDVVRRLVEECGFNAVYFESSIYDFVDFQRQIDRGSASPEMLADAIGGIWSTTSETDPLIAYLYAKAKAGNVYLAGLDLQLGSPTSVYQRSALPIELTGYLAEPRRTQCVAEIKRLTNWTYEDDKQYDAARAALRDCAIEIQKGISAKGDAKAKTNARAATMAENFRRYIDLSSDEYVNKRDKAMYDNYVWQRAHKPDRNKVIVWCATVHAAKDLSFLANGRLPLGSFIHSLRKDNAAAIGFTALGGSYGRDSQAPTTLAPAASDSLESRAFADEKGDIFYLDHKQLGALGKISARPLDYGKSMNTNWSNVVDGMIVLREEHPPHFVHSARPQQAIPKQE